MKLQVSLILLLVVISLNFHTILCQQPDGTPTPAPTVSFPDVSDLATMFQSSVAFSLYADAAPSEWEINNLRNKIERYFFPPPSYATYEGIFNNYFFDTRHDSSGKCQQLFCPSYSAALSPDPLYEESANELYLAVGLDAGYLALLCRGKQRTIYKESNYGYFTYGLFEL
eukprot:TRINITY_DN10023_c0_g2_i2.p1 TRINITY_DN10023_c0_g2~~TRINITY_DN10023_c0_g2_i2.p1  ORF type:complete len:170 (-),score=18.99 TRINITY_DN10023_c0_g2_i2:44-553(-)